MIKLLLSFLFVSPLILSSQQLIESEGGIKLSNVSPSDLTPIDEGTVRYNSKNKDFEGWNGTNWISLTTGLKRGSVKDVNGKEYETVIIGDQEWMAENLATISYRNGDLFSFGLSNSEWSSRTTSALSFVNNDSGNTEDYGILYNWFATIEPRGVCPIGWDVPTSDQWEELRDYLGTEFNGTRLKEEGLEHWSSKLETNGLENNSGFNARGAGIRDGSNGDYKSFLSTALFWSQTEKDVSEGKGYTLFQTVRVIITSDTTKETGASIRCVKI